MKDKEEILVPVFELKEMEMKSQILNLLNSDIGFGINIFGILCIRGLENGKFAVSCDLGEEWEEVLDTSEEAVEFFLKVRKEKKLGTDFE